MVLVYVYFGIAKMFHKLFIIYILIATAVSFAYLKSKYSDFKHRELVLFVLGVTLFCVGTVMVNMTKGPSTLLEYLTFQEFHHAGRIVLIGYILVLMSLFFFLDKLLTKFVSKKGPKNE